MPSGPEDKQMMKSHPHVGQSGADAHVSQSALITLMNARILMHCWEEAGFHEKMDFVGVWGDVACVCTRAHTHTHTYTHTQAHH